MSKIFKRILTNLVTDAGIEVVRGYAIQRLHAVTPQDLLKAIKEGTHTLSVTTAKDHAFAKKWTPIMEKLSIDGKKLQKEQLTPQNVLEWLKTDRPDLAKVIIDCKEQGAAWLVKDVHQMFDFLFAPPQQIQRIGLVKCTPAPSTVKNNQSTSESQQQQQK